MTSFWAIVKLTFRSAIRSHIFQLLLGLLIICVFLIPSTIASDGTAWGFIQISLKYSLAAVGTILSFSTVWLSCFIMTRDVETYQLHMVVSKPVSRITIWVGKWLGVVLIHLILMLIASGIVYGLILWQFYGRDFSQEERKRIENEVLVGRRVFRPELPDLDRLVREEYQKRLKVAQKSNVDLTKINQSPKKTMREIRKEVIARLSEVKPGPANTRYWTYKGLAPDWKTPLFIRYRPYVGKISSKEQRETRGVWLAEMLVKENREKDAEGKGGKKDSKTAMRAVLVPRTPYPEGIMCGEFSEITLTPRAIHPDGLLVIGYTNFDPKRKSVFFQLADGPKVLVKVTDFLANYLRAVFVLFLKILFLAGLSCAVASFVTMPTAIFSVVCYGLFGVFATYLVGMERDLMDTGMDMSTVGFVERFGTAVSHVLLWFVIPLQNFEISDVVASGELIEFSYVGTLFLNIFILRGLPLFLLGMFLYWRRELGLVIRK